MITSPPATPADTSSTNLRWMFVVAGLLLPTLVTWIYFTALAGQPPIFQKAAYSIGKTIQFSLPVLAFYLLGNWIVTCDPEYRRSLLLGLGSGLAIGLTIYCFNRFVLVPMGVMDAPQQEVKLRLQEVGIATLPAYLAVALGYAFVHSLLEEYFWRWFVFGNLCKLVSVETAIGLSSVGFMLHHILVLSRYFGFFSIWTAIASLGVAVGGIVWAWLYRRHGTLLGLWLSHGIVDAAIFLVGYELAFG